MIDKNIEAIAIRQVQLYHSPFGAEYIVGRKLKSESQLPNVFGGEPFPSVLTAELIDINKLENRATLAGSQEIDRAKATQIIEEFVRKMVRSDTKQKNISTLEINAINRFVIELNTGWLTDVDFQRTVRAGDLKNVDEIKIEIVK